MTDALPVVRLIFTRRRHLGSLLLRTALWSAWSHCVLVDGDTVIEAAAGEGVQTRPLAELIADASEWMAVDVPCRDPNRILDAARSQLGRRYDWMGVLGIGFRRRWQSPRRWFCSELIAYAFDAAGEPLFRVQPWRITPRDLYLPVFSRACAPIAHFIHRIT